MNFCRRRTARILRTINRRGFPLYSQMSVQNFSLLWPSDCEQLLRCCGRCHRRGGGGGGGCFDGIEPQLLFWFPMKINCSLDLLGGGGCSPSAELKQTICGVGSSAREPAISAIQCISIHCDSRINSVHEMQMRWLFSSFLSSSLDQSSSSSRSSARTGVNCIHVYPRSSFPIQRHKGRWH